MNNDILYIAVPVTAWFVANLIKFAIPALQEKDVDFRRFYQSGGMPSAHTTLVASLTTILGIGEGFTSPVFAISAVFTIIVIYDAMGVRRSVGLQVAKLNAISKHIGIRDESALRDSKMFNGHSKREVLAGALLGIGVALLGSPEFLSDLSGNAIDLSQTLFISILAANIVIALLSSYLWYIYGSKKYRKSNAAKVLRLTLFWFAVLPAVTLALMVVLGYSGVPSLEDGRVHILAFTAFVVAHSAFSGWYRDKRDKMLIEIKSNSSKRKKKTKKTRKKS